MTTDFREAIAAATREKMERVGCQSLPDLGESGCVPIPGGRGWLNGIDVFHVIIAAGCLLALAATFLLSVLGVIHQFTFYAVSLGGLAVTLLLRQVKAGIVRVCLTMRADNLIKAAGGRATRPVGIEDARTIRKIKLVIEDRGVCVFDPEQHRLLIEGFSYRYVIYARDVFLVEAAFRYASSGALIRCRMAGQVLEMVLKTDGQGPVASLIQSFNPETGANQLARLINETLFGAKGTTVYRQRELPPPLASA
ncbi:hypothetical protein SBV1_180013 [Verrucomicrobia bacterium]|nr:hypothetical protein SBV1_180013 [Verrucomicrobiota bacterium]